MRGSVILLAALLLMIAPAAAQLAGTDTAPGDACSLSGSTMLTADSDGDGGSVTLVCNGTTWEPEAPSFSGSCNDGDSVVYDAASGGFRCDAGGSGGGTLAGLSDVNITSPEDGVALVYDSASGNWINKTCDDSPETGFVDLINQSQSTQVSSSIQTINGITCASIDIAISGDGGPQYRICSDASCSSVTVNWTSGSSTATGSDYIQIRLTTSTNASETYTANVVMGSNTADWNVTTVGPKTVFVTSSQHSGDLQGLAGADNICQGLADSAGLTGTYLAWLSDGSVSPDSRFNKSAQDYQLVGGTVIANGWTDLTNGNIDNYINRNENGSTVGNVQAWTNTNTNGTAVRISAMDTCDSWTEGAFNSNQDIQVGNTQSADSNWTSMYADFCDSSNRLYCFEQ